MGLGRKIDFLRKGSKKFLKGFSFAENLAMILDLMLYPRWRVYIAIKSGLLLGIWGAQIKP